MATKRVAPEDLVAKVEELRAKQAELLPAVVLSPAPLSSLTTSTCRACGAEIIWCKTRKARRIPVDAQPAAGGNVVIEVGARATVLNKDDAADLASSPGVPLRWPHHATCPTWAAPPPVDELAARRHSKGTS